MNWKKFFSLIFVIIGAGLITLAAVYIFDTATTKLVHPLSKKEVLEKEYPLKAYSFPELKQQPANPSQINLGDVLSEEDEFRAYEFSYQTMGKNMTGQINVPKEATPSAGFPVIMMLRGFVDPAIYETGVGTRNGAKFFAENGFVTIAPDFLGYGGSDNPDADVLAARFQKPKNVINLIASLQSLKFVNPDKLGIWAHSNGGQIGLSVLEITEKKIPTTLWAPVSKSFPYSILFFTDEYDDQGKSIRKVLADFEQDYDVFEYSIDNYWEAIQAPLQLHHGVADDAAPVEWSDELSKRLDNLDIEIEYFRYDTADHNMRPSWSEAIQKDLEFFNDRLEL